LTALQSEVLIANSLAKKATKQGNALIKNGQKEIELLNEKIRKNEAIAFLDRTTLDDKRLRNLEEERSGLLVDLAQKKGQATALIEFRNAQLRKATEEELLKLTKVRVGAFGDIQKFAARELQRRKDINTELEETETTTSNIAGNTEKQLTGLEKLKDDLRKVKKERSDILVIDGKTAEFFEKSNEAAVLENKIRLLEEELNKKRELQRFDNRGREEVVSDIMPVSDQALQDYQDLLGDVEEANEDAGQSFEDLAATATLALESLNNIVQAKAQERVDFLDREIEASRNHQEVLRTIAQEGVADAEDNLAFEQQKQAELEAEKQRQIERAAQLELVLSAVQTFNNEVQQGATAGEAISSTAVAMASLEALVRGLDFFYEGTEDTGTVRNPLDSNGGRLAVLHDNERVMTADQNKELKGMTNWEVVNTIAESKQGTDKIQQAIIAPRFSDSTHILQKFDELKASIDNKPVYLGRDYDATERAIVETIRRGNNIERNHKKTGGIW